MNSTVFSRKLDEIPLAIERTLASDNSALSSALRQGQNTLSMAVGSGGSVVSAQYLARCRSTSGYAATIVRTPEEFVLDGVSLDCADVWIFSAGGGNADALAAFEAAKVCRAKSIRVVTGNPRSALAESVSATPNATLHAIDIEGRKDRFLATHSLIATIVALALSAQEVARLPSADELAASIAAAARTRLSAQARTAMKDLLADFKPDDCLLLLADPRLQAAAVLIETSLWEAAVCPVQRSDFRNFAHGRHVWPFKRNAGAFVLALSGVETRTSLATILDNLSLIRFASTDYADCGRFQALLAVLDAMNVVENLGLAVGIDPGRPGTAPNAPRIYDSETLWVTAKALDAPTRQKVAAQCKSDNPDGRSLDWPRLSCRFRERIGAAEFGGIVLDYDGTIIPAGKPFAPPRRSSLDQIIRLLDVGVRIAIATGRGGSLGESLREALPERWWNQILVGYYNGAYLKPLAVDIRREPPAEIQAISDFAALLEARPELFLAPSIKNSRVQISIESMAIRDVDAFKEEFTRSRFGGSSELKMLDTGRTIDIVQVDTCKTSVLDELRKQAVSSAEILCIGDNGDKFGNDHILLAACRT